VAGVADWQAISPDDHGDWLRQRDDSFSEFIVLGDKNGDGLKLFDNFSLGVVTNRMPGPTTPARTSCRPT
jgi:predicted helicase